MSKRERFLRELGIAAYLALGTIGVVSLFRDPKVYMYIVDTLFSLVMYWEAVDDLVSLIRKSIQNDYFDEDNDFEKKTKKNGTNIPMSSTGATAPKFRRMTDPPMPRKTKPLEPLAPKR